jgi:hypothetical protein
LVGDGASEVSSGGCANSGGKFSSAGKLVAVM